MQKQKTIIHLVRHGEVDNPQSLRYGRMPGFHLSESGRKQVESLNSFFIPRKIAHIYSSPLERTQQTATLLGLAFPHVRISLDARILENKTAATFEGKPRRIGFYYPTHETIDAETADEIILRFWHFMEEKITQHNGQEIIAVSHSDPIALIYTKLVYNTTRILKGHYPWYASVYSFVFVGLTLKEVWYYEHDCTQCSQRQYALYTP
jgi:broad specificity phosphatase PhoE